MKKICAGSLTIALLAFSCLFVIPNVNGVPSENSWETMASMLTGRRGLGVATLNGKIYAIGGESSSGTVNEMYNPAKNTWATKKSMSTPRCNFATAVFNNKIYCIGGLFPPSGVTEVYDPVTDTWETKQPMPTPRGALSASVVNDKIYVIGGVGPSRAGFPAPEPYNLNEVYDPATDSWTTMAPLPTAVAYSVSAVVDNKIYVFGNGDAAQIYDPQTNTWSQSPSSSFSVSYGAVAATTGVYAPKKIYCIGGLVYSNETDPETLLLKRGPLTQIFDPETETWSTGAEMPTPRRFLSVAVVDDLLYAIGGQENRGYGLLISNANERYTPLGYTPVPPAVNVVSPEQNMTYAAGDVSLTFTVDRSVAELSYSLNGGANVTVTGNTTLTGLTNGVHNVTVYAADSAGNVGASQTIHFTIAPAQSDTEPFSPALVAAASGTAIAVVGACLLVYFKKHRHQTSFAS